MPVAYTDHTLAPIEVDVVVSVGPDRAFALYVDRPGRRHPADGLSDAPSRIVYEPVAGGRWYEVDADGGEHDWGRVLVWEPGRRLVLAWMVGVSDGRWAFDPDPHRASRAEITFTAAGAGRTRVRAVHTGFEAHGDAAASIRGGAGAEGGWREDLEDLARVASSPLRVLALQVNLFCDDVAATLAHYRALGLPETFRVEAGGELEHAEIDAAGARVGLTSTAAANRLVGLGVARSSSVHVEIVLWCDDAQRLHDAAVAHGATSMVAPVASPNGRLLTGWVRDPEGHQVNAVQKR